MYVYKYTVYIYIYIQYIYIHIYIYIYIYYIWYTGASSHIFSSENTMFTYLPPRRLRWSEGAAGRSSPNRVPGPHSRNITPQNVGVRVALPGHRDPRTGCHERSRRCILFIFILPHHRKFLRCALGAKHINIGFFPSALHSHPKLSRCVDCSILLKGAIVSAPGINLLKIKFIWLK